MQKKREVIISSIIVFFYSSTKIYPISFLFFIHVQSLSTQKKCRNGFSFSFWGRYNELALIYLILHIYYLDKVWKKMMNLSDYFSSASGLIKTHLATTIELVNLFLFSNSLRLCILIALFLDAWLVPSKSRSTGVLNV